MLYNLPPPKRMVNCVVTTVTVGELRMSEKLKTPRLQLCGEYVHSEKPNKI